jgi:hypothetical protein
MSWTLDNLQTDSEYECLVQASHKMAAAAWSVAGN